MISGTGHGVSVERYEGLAHTQPQGSQSRQASLDSEEDRHTAFRSSTSRMVDFKAILFSVTRDVAPFPFHLRHDWLCTSCSALRTELVSGDTVMANPREIRLLGRNPELIEIEETIAHALPQTL